MKRNLLNVIVDILSLIVFSSMIATGLLLEFVLPPGSGSLESMGRGRGAGRMIYTFLGTTRHEWGSIHFFLSLLFLALILIHLVLHWRWIIAVVWGTRERPQSWKRRAVVLSALVFMGVILALPWTIERMVYSRSELQQFRQQQH